MNKLDELLKYQKEISDLQCIVNILNWELRVNAPEKSKEYYVDLLTKYSNKLFVLQTNDEYGKLLNCVINSDEYLSLEEAEQRYIQNQLRYYNENKNVPEDFHNEFVKQQNITNMKWEEAKDKNDYSIYKPYLEDMFNMVKKYYRYIDSETPNLYDVMLSSYQPGIKSSLIDKLFGEMKESLLKIIPKEVVDVPKYERDYSVSELKKGANFLLDYIGFDMDRGSLGNYPHGFMEKMSRDDERIAFDKDNNIFTFVSTIIHEGGHGIFEQNIDPKLSRYENISIPYIFDVHESQSRFFENILGRNKNFWIPIYDEFSKLMHIDLSLDEFVKGLNTATPSLIRTRADELTYPMHIILRYEIERDLFNGKISFGDLPNIWNQKMKEYLNMDVEKDSDGLMQDMHWSDGSFGYFPSYLLGTIYDGMYIDAIEKNLGSIDELLRNGKIKDITKFLNNHIHKFGGAYNAIEVIKRVCGKEISTEPIIRYFENKYGK